MLGLWRRCHLVWGIVSFEGEIDISKRFDLYFCFSGGRLDALKADLLPLFMRTVFLYNRTNFGVHLLVGISLGQWMKNSRSIDRAGLDINRLICCVSGYLGFNGR